MADHNLIAASSAAARGSSGDALTIGIGFDVEQRWTRDVFAGLAEAARSSAHAGRPVRFLFCGPCYELPLTPAVLRQLDGLIGDPQLRLPRRRSSTLRTVRLGLTSPPAVAMDPLAEGRLAVEHIIERHHRRIVIVSEPAGTESVVDERRRGALDAAAAAGIEAIVHDVPPPARGRSQQRIDARLARVLRAQQKPFGVVGLKVLLTLRALRAIAALGLRVPRDVGVISSGDDEILLGHASPSVSAVLHNQPEIGRRALRLLLRQIDGEAVPDRTNVAPLGVIARASTDYLAIDDPRVEPIVRHIWKHIAGGVASGSGRPLTLTDLARQFDTTSRTILRWFDASLGQTPQEVIRSARLETARRLLVSTDLPLTEIATRVGFSSQSQLGRHLKNAIGETPAEYRAKRRGG